MVFSSLIIVVSIALFLYWFRYTCVLILTTKTSKDYSGEVASANQLSFLDVERTLESSLEPQLAALQSSLERDYELVSSLISQAAKLEVGGDSLEGIMLRIDFRIMKLWFSLSQNFSPSAAKSAVQEMAQIVSHLANAFGEQTEGLARS